jgi:dienelactone hydrolase
MSFLSSHVEFEIESFSFLYFSSHSYGVTNRVRAIADTIASEGYVVLVVDCYYGDTVVKTPDMVEFLSKFSYDKISKEIGAAIDFLVSKSVDKESIAALGFCWGGWAIAKSASEGVCWKCAVSPHPATKVEGFIWKNDEKAMFEKFPMPFLLMPAADDPDLLKPGSSVVDLLEEKGGKSVPFPRMKHGWVSRGDLSKDEVKEDAEKALQLATDFIKANN